MKKNFFVILIFLLTFLFFSFIQVKNIQDAVGSRDIVLAFISYNDYGNNLYIDNVSTGIQQNNDITVTSFNNIPHDTTYSTNGNVADTISPIVSVSNIGRNSITDRINVYLLISPGGYFNVDTIHSLASGQTTTATFPLFNFVPGVGYYLKAYSSYSLDSNHFDDTLSQYSILLPGTKRNVLFEEFTSMRSPASANNNPDLNNYINANISGITAIKYHIGNLGTDSLYLANPVQSDARRNYYNVTASPTLKIDGRLTASIPYGDTINLSSPRYSRLAIGTPFSINVSDERIAGDSIRTTVSINVISSALSGNYKLRVCAVERMITYSSPPGTNGERIFYDVFRRAYPNTDGINISTSVGSYQYQFTYLRQSNWIDSMIYTAAFIQNDNTREVMNCAKGRNFVSQPFKNIYQNISNHKADLFDAKIGNGKLFRRKASNIFSDTIQTQLNVELFEGAFPPLGWRIYNNDGNITFAQYTGVNGPTIGGMKCVFMDFYDYTSRGQYDTLFSKAYTNLLSSDTVRFDYAYAQYSSLFRDSLIVKVSTDGGQTFPFTIFRKGGASLATAPQTTSKFVPTGNGQWQIFKFGLSSYVLVQNQSSFVPSEFKLEQNYPNPFNPVTVIRYSLIENRFVSLKVYDVLGKEVVTLVNQKQNAGSYSVEFDGSRFSSGMYFYRIEITGDNSQEKIIDTKRMMLIK